jgi:hypothetical protein
MCAKSLRLGSGWKLGWENTGLGPPQGQSAERALLAWFCTTLVQLKIFARVDPAVVPRDLGGNVSDVYRGRMRFFTGVFRRDDLDLATPNRARLKAKKRIFR